MTDDESKWANDPRHRYRQVQGWRLTGVATVTLQDDCEVAHYTRDGDKQSVWMCPKHQVAMFMASSHTLTLPRALDWHASCLDLIKDEPDVWSNRFAQAAASVSRAERAYGAADREAKAANAKLAKALAERDKQWRARTSVLRKAQAAGIPPKVSGPEMDMSYSAARRALERAADLKKVNDADASGAPGAAGGS